MKTKYFISILVLVVLFLQSCSSGFTVSYTGDYCEDGIMDRDETDVDCGGQYCDECSDSESEATTATADCGDTTYTATLGDEISFDGSASSGSGTLTYSWDVDGDGSEDTGSVTYDYFYDTAGTYDAILTITDEDGNTDECTIEVTVEEEVADADADGVADGDDVCEDYDDTADADSDTVPDGCDLCDEEDDTVDDDANDIADCLETEEDTTTDTDGDGLTDDEEIAMGSDPLDPDMDDDGLTDYEEEVTYGTELGDADSDDDGLGDYEEINGYGSLGYSADPLVADTDGDGLLDGEEADQETDAQNEDSDGDGFSDYDEVEFGTDPTWDQDHPVKLAEGESVTVTPSDDNDYTVTVSGAEAASCTFEIIVGPDSSSVTVNIEETTSLGGLEITVVETDTDSSCTFVTNANVFS